MGIKCFWLEPAFPASMRCWLRRYANGPCALMPGQFSYHHARSAPIGDVAAEIEADTQGWRVVRQRALETPDESDPRWPTHCACGYAFQDRDARQLFTHLLYRRADTGEILPLEDAPAGAMYDAWCYARIPEWRGPDGRALMVRCPDGHDWHVDGRASNCTLPEDKAHKCWVRHGEPPMITVDKNGLTCSAGAGSIATPKWHGFLRNGELVA